MPTTGPGFLSAFDNVLVAFYVFRFVEGFGPALIARMLIGVTDSGRTFRWIGKEGLAGFADGAGYDKIPLKRNALG